MSGSTRLAHEQSEDQPKGSNRGSVWVGSLSLAMTAEALWVSVHLLVIGVA